MPRMVERFEEYVYSSNIYPKKNYKLNIIHGAKRKIRKTLLHNKEPYVKESWLKLEENHATHSQTY